MISELLLPKLAEWQPSGVGRHSWSHTLPDQGWNLYITADKADSLGCLIWELSATRTYLIPATLQGVRSWTDRLASKASGLMEPLRVIEVDSTRLEAILRSDSPSSRGENVFYYEVKIMGQSRGELRRYQTSPKLANRREQVPFALTHEVIAKFFSDLIAD